MTPENIAGFSIPQAQLQALIDALAGTHGDDNVVVLHPQLEKAA